MNPSEDPEIHSDGSEESDDAAAPKARTVRSSRACITCRRMKTRCEIDEALGNACKLCIRARRQCIMQDLPRRRKRKTTERVADLEQKINALTALLSANESNSPVDHKKLASAHGDSTGTSASKVQTLAKPDNTLIAEALSRGLFTWETACKAFERYKNEMCRYFPFVVFASGSDAAAVKQQQPLLFFAVITVSLASMQTTVDAELCDMLIKDLALRVVYTGERSLELVQTLIVHILFYGRAKNMRDLNFNQMVHIASTMALDIGLGRRPHKSTLTQRTDPHQLESLAGRRAWLGCYYMGTSVSMSLRHPAFVRWSVYTEECLDVLSDEASVLPSDMWLCDLIRIQHIAEDASVTFSMDDPGAIVTLRDVKIQYQIRGFRQQLDYWRRHAKTDLTLRFASMCSLPNIFFVRTGYAARALRKLLNICDSQAEFEGRSHVDVRDLKFEEYLTAIIDVLRRVHAQNNSVVARAFCLVLSQIKTQGLNSSKLLSAMKRADEAATTRSRVSPTSASSMPSNERFDLPCLHSDESQQSQRTESLTYDSGDLNSAPPPQLPHDQIPLDAQTQAKSAQWLENDTDDAFMSGIDVLQWFEQDLAFDDPAAYDYDSQLTARYWQQ
ncbi:Fungal specific transcription factor domain-containing protein [Cladophialophora immunda]|nr:Fungal specific transcription factor domain-containing protein [Cladophialophora immunda]